MASYSGDFNKMQEEALARLRDMQKRSRTAVNRPQQEKSASEKAPDPQPKKESFETRRQSAESSRQRPPDIFGSLFSDMKIDSEKALILLMLFVLYKNKADVKLLLALGYLLM